MISLGDDASEATPIKLPLPLSPPHNKNNSNAPINVDEDDDPFDDNNASLDVHIRWTVDSGSVVQTGEKVAQLLYCYHGTQAPPLTGSITTKSSSASGNNGGGSSIIRARTKKKRWAATATSSQSSATNNSSNSNNSATHTTTLQNESNNNNFVTLDIRAPSNGFLRIIYKKSYAYNAVHYTSDVKSVISLILGAIEPCEHPAVVGGLCAVCGVDITRGKVATAAKSTNASIPRNPIRNKPVVDRKQQQIIDKQKKLAASIESTKELDDEMVEEWDNFDQLVGTKVASKLPPAAAKPKPPVAAAPSQMRSLSSLLSGAKATQKLQQAPSTKQKQPSIQRQHQRPAIRRQQHHRTASPTNNQSNNDMSKMTVSGGVTITVSKSEAKNISDASSKKLHSEKKLCLVLDLDHTLLHATDDYRAGRFVADEIYDEDEKKEEDNDSKLPHQGKKTKPNPDKRKDVRSILLPVELSPADQQMYIQTKFDQQKIDTSHNFCLTPLPQQKQGNNNGPSSTIIMRHYIKLRPNLKEFLQQISSTYQLSVYTAGTRAYAEQVAIMICRHLVGTEYDEEGLNTLRGRVREKDEECRRYTAKVARKKQLELAKAREDDDDNEVQVVEVKNGGGLKKAASGKPIANKTGTSSGSSKPTVAIEASTSVDSECTASSSSSSQKRSNSGKDIEMKIPRKKKRVNFGSLLPPVSVEPIEMNEEKSKAEEELIDPTAERDRLRKMLDEAESLEIKAVELRRKMFGSRIVSRTDVGDLGKDVKSLKRVFPCGGVMAAILDDREDVWANAKNNVTGRPGEPPDNLLLVKPYHWKPFQGYADVNNASGQDLSSKTEDNGKSPVDKPDEKETDAQLLWTADILRRLHERYYSSTLSKEEREGISVPSLLQAMRKETFLRFPQVKVVFSGLIPIHKQNKQVQIRPHVVRYAEELGAEVLPSITEEVTHVVAARDRSEKIRQARKEVPSCFIVHTSWLMECYWSITRKDVRPYHMGPVPDQSQRVAAAVGNNNNKSTNNKKVVEESKPSHSKKKEDTILLLDSDEEESDEDDESDNDDFAADLESEMMKQG